MADGTDPLGDDNLRRLRQCLGKACPQGCVRLIIQGGEGVVKDQDLRLPCQSPGDGKPLLLPAGEVPPLLGDGIGCALVQAADKFGRLGQLQRCLQVSVRIVAGALAEEDVFPNAAGEQGRPLADKGQLVIQGVEAVLPHIGAVQQDMAVRRVIEPGNEIDQCRLAAASGADDR